MNEPLIFGLPLSLAFLYFITYSVVGWAMETVYCSILEKHLVSRGFLYGPLCPIYGVGVLMMICWFQPLLDKPVVFYLVATVCMSAWEYLVGWFLETTTHIKCWDYSMYKFNLHGRICLWVCLTWGALSFLVLYFIHPRVAGWLSRFQGVWLYFVDGMLLGALLFDAVATVYELARAARVMEKLRQAGDELRLQAALGKAELSDILSDAKDVLTDQLDDLLPEQLTDAGRAAKVRYDELMSSAEVATRRFRRAFGTMAPSGGAAGLMESIKRRGEKVTALLKGVVLKDPTGESKK